MLGRIEGQTNIIYSYLLMLCHISCSNASAVNLVCWATEESSLQSVHQQLTEVSGGFGQGPFSQGNGCSTGDSSS